ncbi:hypothetical protein [Nitrosophilus kaiyonis]|uniref:hypothetical protein n=1 Tax=Nitrosophilus kaiyonis TaxID=2930200 RepID=UPI00248FB620|nr:hypothetical protein [Nitrosophilus kaiyonis]
MRFIFVSIIIVNFFTIQIFAQAEKKEIEIEIKKLEALKKDVELKIKKNEKILEEIKKEQKKLNIAKKELEKLQKELNKERYKKLAKAFEGMEPEMAGEKLSKIDDPAKAAYILYNMKAKSAGEALNYVDPKRVSEIVKILTSLKKQNEK